MFGGLNNFGCIDWETQFTSISKKFTKIKYHIKIKIKYTIYFIDAVENGNKVDLYIDKNLFLTHENKGKADKSEYKFICAKKDKPEFIKKVDINFVNNKTDILVEFKSKFDNKFVASE